MVDSKEIKRKVILLGDGAVGKTSLIRRFVVDKFDDKYITTIGTKITVKELQITVDEEVTYLKFQIWDILGQKGYTRLYNTSFPGTSGVFLVADITRKKTLESLERYWIPEVQNIVGDVPFVILANKSDLINSAEFGEIELKEFASKYEAPFYLTSAKTGGNVNKAFYVLGKRMVNFLDAEPKKPEKSKKPRLLEGENTEIVRLIDRIIDDFCKGFGRQEDAMPILRKQFELAELDIQNPTKEAIIRVVDRLADIETGFKEKEMTEANRVKRLNWIKEIKEKKMKS